MHQLANTLRKYGLPLIEDGQGEGGGRLVDQWRHDLVLVVLGVPPDAEAEQADEHEETEQGQQAAHATDAFAGGVTIVVAVAAEGARLARKRRSAAATKPPAIMKRPPSQIQRTKGLRYRRNAH